MYQILLVEDDVQICEVITEYFHNKNEMQITVAHDKEIINNYHSSNNVFNDNWSRGRLFLYSVYKRFINS